MNKDFNFLVNSIIIVSLIIAFFILFTFTGFISFVICSSIGLTLFPSLFTVVLILIFCTIYYGVYAFSIIDKYIEEK